MAGTPPSKNRQNLMRQLGSIFFIGGFGIFWALQTMGAMPFDIFNTEWLQGDFSQVYYAWKVFMREPWSSGLSTSMMSTPIPLAISLFDAMPLFACLAKPFQFFIPENTQFFGIYFTFCIILQGILGYQISLKLVAYPLKTGKQSVRLIAICLAGALFCMTSPSVMNRFAAHTALSSQWLLLTAILVSLRWSNASIAKWTWTHGGTLFVATGINPYLALLVGINFSVFTFLSKESLNCKRGVIQMVLLVGIAIFGLWIFGFLTGALPGGGYGYYSMNLLGPFDSNGFGKIWGINVPDATGGQAWEGFVYLGFGAIALISAAVGVIFTTKNQGQFPYNAALMVVLCVFLLSLSNTVTVAHWRFIIPLPDFLLSSLSLFRASGRFFWIGGFWLIFLSMAVIVRRLDWRMSSSIIVICAFLQVIDVSGIASMTKSKINGLHRIHTNFTPILKSGSMASKLLIYPPWQCDPQGSPTGVRSFEIFNDISVTYQIPINSFYTARTPVTQSKYHCDFPARFAVVDPTAIYVMTDAIWKIYGNRLSKSHLCARDITLDSAWVCR